jgi:isopentenyl diphosphate isomerase/L-lactate dehydrogenase-like FMN-dependent dehydrogenase
MPSNVEKKKDLEKLFDSEEIEKQIRDYLAHRFNLKDDIQVRNRIEVIKNASSVNYYHRVREVLPEVVEMAVLAAIGADVLKREDYEKIVEESLEIVKRMMIFYRLREDQEVVKTIVQAKVAARYPH